VGPPIKPKEADLVALRDGGKVGDSVEFALERDPAALEQLLDSRILALLLAHRSTTAPELLDASPVDVEQLLRYIGNDLDRKSVRRLERQLRHDSQALTLLLDLREAVAAPHPDSDPSVPAPEPTRETHLGTLRLECVGDIWLLKHVPRAPRADEGGPTMVLPPISNIRMAASRESMPLMASMAPTFRSASEDAPPRSADIASRFRRLRQGMDSITGELSALRDALAQGTDDPGRTMEDLEERFIHLADRLMSLGQELTTLRRLEAERRRKWQEERRLRTLRSQGWESSVRLRTSGGWARLSAQTGDRETPHLVVHIEGHADLSFDATVLIPKRSFRSYLPGEDRVLRLPLPRNRVRVLLHIDQTYALEIEH